MRRSCQLQNLCTFIKVFCSASNTGQVVSILDLMAIKRLADGFAYEGGGAGYPNERVSAAHPAEPRGRLCHVSTKNNTVCLWWEGFEPSRLSTVGLNATSLTTRTPPLLWTMGRPMVITPPMPMVGMRLP